MADVEIPGADEVESGERGIGIAISILAVLLAITSALGNKADNDEIVGRVDESNTWAQYQAKKVRSTTLGLGSGLVEVIATLQGNTEASKKMVSDLQGKYADDMKRYEEELTDIKKKAETFREDAYASARKGDMYDMAEFLFQVSLVLCSITLLLKTKTYFRGGLSVAVAASAVLSYAYFLA